MKWNSIAELVAAAQSAPIWKVILEDDLDEITPEHTEEAIRRMQLLWDTMKKTVAEYDPNQHSLSGLSGGDGARYVQMADTGKLLCDNYLNQVIATALKTGECNACMKRIVAAPTAGSCGVIPAVLIPYQQAYPDTTEEEMLHALFVSGGFGTIIAERASISGAEAGCQAEVGAASAMAAAALTYLRGGTPDACANACAMALKNLLGLVCDPVAGLVEVPCIKRNVIGAVNAISCANMALAGIVSHIPADEVIDAMAEVGSVMSATLRETAEGGLAATPTGQRLAKRLQHK
ncbi:L-serine ammonia-lyase, iron-sulfur-dependent, subunit alpha [uncultured Ruminococcus sp.]|jgi:L-serine dehydratase|uniref:L-serine ammonia-lyase, iron-sulfur-dependent, subunit alpha n=1 Tax=uncultured Ruminococcus sp. TaxID=165186 RepID=UPI0026047E19|nr:L-serine ammonia-lyase, iron-sulfur-dependent, subunit alpha [uncultured Ruminococcus sp.]